MRLYRIVKNVLFRIRLRYASPLRRAELMKSLFFYCGENVRLYTTSFGTEPYLISIHDNVTCAAGVHFINHDVSIFNIARFKGISESEVDKVGGIELFENSFVGAYSILLPGCSVGRNSIVAAGSIVTKRIPDNEVWGGVPAKYIMKVEDYAETVISKSKDFPWLKDKDFMPTEKLIKLRQEYFFLR